MRLLMVRGCVAGVIVCLAILILKTAGQPAASNAAAQSAPTTAPASQPAPPLVKLPAGGLSIVALGDSLTEGGGDESGKGYPGRLVALIQAVRPGSKITNLGKSGWTSENLIKGHDNQPSQLKQAVAAKPQLALVWIGSNDLWYLYEYGNPDGTSARDEQDDLRKYRQNIETIVRGLKEAGAVVVLALLDDQSKRPVAIKGEAFTGITKAELGQMSKQAAAYNSILREVAAKLGVLTADIQHTSIFTEAATLSDDGNHPNDKGYDAIAQVWFKAIAPALMPPQPRRPPGGPDASQPGARDKP